MASWWFAKSDSEINFTNLSYEEKHTLDFTAPAQGDYLIIVSCAGHTHFANGRIFIRAQLDDTTTIMEGISEPHIGDGRDYPTYSTVYLAENLASGSHYVDIDAMVLSGNTGYMRYMKITVLRLDDWLTGTKDYDSAATEGETVVEGGSWSTIQTLAFTPGTAGDYLILGICEADPDSTTKSLSIRLNYDSGSEYLPVEAATEPNTFLTYEGEDTLDYLCWVWGGIVNIPASSKTILMEGYSETSSQVRKRRIIAIRIAAMDSEANTDEDTSETSTTSQWADRSVVTFTPASTEDYLLLASITIRPATNGETYGSQARLEQTAGTGTGTISQHNLVSGDAGGLADSTPAFTTEIKSLANISQTFKTQWGRHDASGTHHNKGSFIIAIRKPSAATTDYKDIGFKTSLLSADTFKDIGFKTSLWSEDTFKDIGFKTSLLGFSIHDITFKTDLWSADTFKDIAFKTDLWSADTFKDIAFKTDLWGVTIHDIAFKTSLTAIVDYKDIYFKTSLWSEDTFKDIYFKTSLWSEDTFKDIGFKTSLVSEDIFKDVNFITSLLGFSIYDIGFKTSLWSEDTYKDIGFITSLLGFSIYDIAFKTSLIAGAYYKDIGFKTSLWSADTFKDIGFKTSLWSADTFKDIGFKTSLWGIGFKHIAFKTSLFSIATYKDIGFKTSLLSADTFKDIGFITSLWSEDTFKDIGFKTSLWAEGFKDIGFITSLLGFSIHDIAFKTSLTRLITEIIDVNIAFSKYNEIDIGFSIQDEVELDHVKYNEIHVKFEKKRGD